MLTNAQVSKIRKAFENDSSTNVKFSKTQLSKMIHSGRFVPIPKFGSPTLSKTSSEPLITSYVKELNNIGSKQLK